MGKEYINLPFPWHSKSKLGDDGYCKWQYYDRYILKNVQKKQRPSVEGTNMHMVFAMFFGDLKYEDLEPFISTDSTSIVSKHPFKRYIYERCMKYVKPSDRGNFFYQNAIRNFATIETERFIELLNRVTNKKEIYQYFKPLYTEQRFEIESIKWFGTRDRVGVIVDPDRSKKIIIIDYKTGRVPTKIKEGLKNPLNKFSWSLPSSKMEELHFYGLTFLLQAGWQLSEEVIDFLMDEKWWFYTKDNLTYDESKELKKKYLKSLNTRKNNRWKIYKGEREFKQGDIILCIYYLGGDKPYKVLKEFNYRSYGSVIRHSNDLRSRQYNGIFVDHPSYVFDEFVCENFKRCGRVEVCKELCKE